MQVLTSNLLILKIFYAKILFTFLIVTSNCWALSTFPGAEGGGAAAIGGRGGKIIEVTNLNKYGPGSFKAACESSGPRTIVFRVGGIIDMQGERIVINDPFITIAGQTAPGGGVLLKACPFSIKTHDVVIRFIRFRLGAGVVNLDNMSFSGGAHNIVIDHCSFSWGTDENIGLYAASGSPYNITFSWNIIAEGLLPHSCGVLTGSADKPEGMFNIDFHHNLFISNGSRNPQITIASSRIINNIIYNWGQRAIGISGAANVDILGNKFKEGANLGPLVYEVKLKNYGGTPSFGLKGNPSIYISNNLGPNQPKPEGDNWSMITTTFSPMTWTSTGNQPERATHERLAPLTCQVYPITIHNVTLIENLILPDVGASRRVDGNGNWITNRDAVDKRLIREYERGTGQIPFNEQAVGGYPTIANAPSARDFDHDGMPDSWEEVNRLNKKDPSDANNVVKGNRYTNIEVFFNGAK